MAVVPWNRLIALRWLAACLLCWGAAAPAARATEVGLDLIGANTATLAQRNVADSVDAAVQRWRALLNWKLDLPARQRLNVAAEREDYRFESEVAKPLIALQIGKLSPRYRIDAGRVGLEAGLLTVNFARSAAPYRPLADDHSDTFLLPVAVAEFRFRPVVLRAGVMQDYDVIPLDSNTYAVTVSRNELAGLSFALTRDLRLLLNAANVVRTYPASLGRTQTDFDFGWRWNQPGGRSSGSVWRELSAIFARRHFPVSGDEFDQVTVTSVFRFAGTGLTHVVTPTVVLSDAYTVYRRGTLPASLLEHAVAEPDFTAGLTYEGAAKLGAGPWLLIWGGKWEESLLRNVRHYVTAHVRVAYTY